jgi:hypothetical protein
MKKTEICAVLAVCILLSIYLSIFYYDASAVRHLDTVFLFECTLSILQSGQPISHSVGTWAAAARTFTTPPEELSRAELVGGGQEYNVIRNHAYVVLYPISILVWLFGPELSFGILNALAHLLLLVIPFVFLRKHGLALIPAAIFILCVMLYPAWSLSAVGDYYLDRLYMPFALLTLYLLHEFAILQSCPTSRLMTALIVSAVGAAMFTERAAIMIIMAIGFYLLSSPSIWKKPKIRYVLLSMVAFLSLYLFTYFARVYTGISEGGSLLGNFVRSPGTILSRFAAPGFVPFALVNLLFLGFLIPFSGFRCIVLVLMAITPNILITVGGAEFNNWLTHYHTMYIPFVIFAASIGFQRLFKHLDKNPWSRYGIPIMIFLCVFISARTLNPYTGKFDRDASGKIKDGVLGKVYAYFYTPWKSSEKVSSGALRELARYIPPKANVSVIEGAMPALYRSRSLSYYPIDMDKADYLVTGGAEKDGKVTAISGAISFLGPEQGAALNWLLYERLTKNGFLLYRTVPKVGILIFKRADSLNSPQ